MTCRTKLGCFRGHTNRGNALFLILIAVALFAALSYAITHSDRGGNTISKEQALIDAGVAQDCTARVEQAVLRLKTLGGCTTDQISYELADGLNSNPNAPVDKSCNVFDPAGGGESPCGIYNPACKKEAMEALGVGEKCATGGVIYVSNNLGERLYTTATDYGEYTTWGGMTAACNSLGLGWRMPTGDELTELYLARHTGALEGSFDGSGLFPGSYYWASTPDGEFRTFNDGGAEGQYGDDLRGIGAPPRDNFALSIRCVRN